LAGITIRSSGPAAPLQVPAADDAAAAGGEVRVGRGAPSLSTTSAANRTRFSALPRLALPPRRRFSAKTAVEIERSVRKIPRREAVAAVGQQALEAGSAEPGSVART